MMTEWNVLIKQGALSRDCLEGGCLSVDMSLTILQHSSVQRDASSLACPCSPCPALVPECMAGMHTHVGSPRRQLQTRGDVCSTLAVHDPQVASVL